MKKGILAVLLALPIACMTACSGGDNSTVTEIQVINYCGGVGKEWLERSIARFKDLKKSESYEEGKTGVEIKVSNTKSVDTSSMKGSAKHIYITEDNGFPYDLAANGSLLNIDSWVKEAVYGESKTIESKIDENFRNVLKYNDTYYALPHYELYPGVTYDYDLFVKKNLFLAAPEETRVRPVTSFGETYNFVANSEAKKSCGNDGKYGTDDDGLPSSIKEFIALCDYMQSLDISPMLFPGNHQDYSSYFMEGLLASLVGKSGINSFYNFEGEVNVVTGYNNDGNYIVNGSGCNTPIVEKVTLTEETGYKVRMTEERYAIICLIKILNDKKHFDETVTQDIGNTNEVVQTLFLEGSRSGGNTKDYGMLCEGNYWVNEAQGRFADFYAKHPEITKRDVRWMSLPTKISETVTEGNGSEPALMDTGNSFLLVNKTLEGKSEGLKRAVKEFVQFLYTDAELEDFTATTGVCKSGVNFNFSGESVYSKLTDFQKTVLNIKKDFGVAYMASKSKTFLSKRNDLFFSINAPIWHPGNNYKSVVEALRANAYDAKGCFESTQITQADWETNYLVK